MVELACQKVIDMVREGEAIAVCPEQLGGLLTPRLPCEQIGEKVFTNKGDDVTAQFELGALEALRIAKENNCDKAILKANSPSCGSSRVFDGTFSHTLIDGDGVTAKLFKKNKIEVVTENEL
ncbi:MAG: DUF523 domain-containing protein [Candidatus Woesearchaeota archaeon]|jgi:uncharacterized protein YbbK (DUF523 family)